MKAMLGFSALVMLGGLLMGYLQQAATVAEEAANDLLVDYLMLMIGVGIGIAAIVFLVFSHRLELEITDYRLRYKFYPWVGWREVTPDQVKGFKIQKARHIRRFGGWGLRYNPFIGQWGYMVKGKYAMELQFVKGKSITMTTTRPQELQKTMEAFVRQKEARVNV